MAANPLQPLLPEQLASRLTLAEIEAAAAHVHTHAPATLQHAWPLLAARCGCDVWVKHENHQPVGAFKLRGGLVYTDALRRAFPDVRGVIAATRGNHGQSVAFCARAAGLDCVIVVPHGNNPEKNQAMTALGAELVEHGHDFAAAFEHAQALSAERGLHFFPSFHPLLVRGVASYALELFRAAPPLARVYVPIGLGSGICGTLAVRDALGLDTDVIGVVSTEAPAYLESFRQRRPVATDSADTVADGIACRLPDARAVERINAGAARIVAVDDAEILAAVRHYFTDTHNLAEGAGAAPLAALLQDGPPAAGGRVGLVLSGGNIDTTLCTRALAP
jgi:threonine dehydratase